MKTHLFGLAALAGATALIASSPAWAHAHLVSSNPAANAAVAAAPKVITLTFNEKLVPAFSKFELTMPEHGGMKVPVNTTVSKDGILYQNGSPVAQLGLFTANIGPNFTRVGNTAIIPGQQPEPVINDSKVGVLQGFVEEANVNPILQMTQMINISRTFDYVSQLMRNGESSMNDAIKTLGGAK